MKGLLTWHFSFHFQWKGINLTFWRQSTNVTVTAEVSEFAARAPFSNLNTNRTPKALGIFLHFDKWKGEFGAEQLAMYCGETGEDNPSSVLSLWCLLNAMRSVFTLFNSYTPHLDVAYTRAFAFRWNVGTQLFNYIFRIWLCRTMTADLFWERNTFRHHFIHCTFLHYFRHSKIL